MFAVRIEPAPQPRLAAAVALLHLLASAAPWWAHCTPALAIALSLLVLVGLPMTLACVPGAHCALQSLHWSVDGCLVRLAGEAGHRPAALGQGSRALAMLVFVDLVVDERHVGWLLPRWVLPPAAFRRLKSRIRLAW